jgi:hypothetical protein
MSTYVRFQVLWAASMNFRVFWDVLPCSQIDFQFENMAVRPWRLWTSMSTYLFQLHSKCPWFQILSYFMISNCLHLLFVLCPTETPLPYLALCFHSLYLLYGAKVLVELWPPHVLYVRFHDNEFLQCGVISPMPNPQPGGPGHLA